MKSNPSLAVLTAILIMIPAVHALCQEAGWKHRVELGAVQTGGNTKMHTFTLGAKTERSWTNGKLSFAAAALNAAQDGHETANQWSAGFDGQRNISGRFNATLSGDIEHDEYAGYKRRIVTGPGLALDIMAGEPHSLSTAFSAVLLQETDLLDHSESYASLKVHALDQWQVNTHIKLKNEFQYFAAVSEADKYLFSWAFSLEASLSKVLAVGINYDLNYQNAPTEASLKKTDTRMTTSLIASF